mmetsp:Transcript_27448/g.33547  ORF Transcript_27448/g.33547 Transcript_27448/m.33547 type:complete len:166 (+) Transcript_27448:301-798(+)
MADWSQETFHGTNQGIGHDCDNDSENEEVQEETLQLGIEKVIDEAGMLKANPASIRIRQRKGKLKQAQKALFPENTIPSDFKIFEKLPTVDLSCGQGLLLKKVIRSGEGNQLKNGQIAVVHYTGYLTSGLKFDSSRERVKSFSFCLGARKVIKGWEIGDGYGKRG